MFFTIRQLMVDPTLMLKSKLPVLLQALCVVGNCVSRDPNFLGNFFAGYPSTSFGY